MQLDHWYAAAGIVVAFVLTAILHRQTVTRSGTRMRRPAILCALYLIAVGLAQVLSQWSLPDAARIAGIISGIFGWLTVLELFTIGLFKIMLPRVGVHAPSIVGDLFFGAAVIVLIVVTLHAFDVDATSIVTTSAVLTGILAISLQATLGNIIGGVALQLDRSIRVGDWIELENGTQGRVQEIHWRHTVIETRDWDSIIVPNATLLAANIMILGKRDGEALQHRMWVYFNVDFRYNPQQVIDTVEKALRASPRITHVAAHPEPNCVCQDFARDGRESYSLYAVRYWLTDIMHDDPTNSLVRQRIYAALKRANIPLAIPAAQLFVDQDSQERRERKNRHDHDERVDALQAIEFLTMLNPDELDHLADGLQPVLYAEDETIMRQDDEADWLYIMTDGQAEVRISANGQERHVTDLHAPTFFGEMGLMTGEPRTATIIARSPVSCYRLYRDSFQTILQERPPIAEEISSILAERDVQMKTIRQQLDEDSRDRQIEEASSNMLGRISVFFGLSEERRD